MNNYKELQNYLINSGNAIVKLSFDNLKEILGIEVNYNIALHIQKNFHCTYKVDYISKKEKYISFCKIEMQNDDGTTITTLTSMLLW